MARHAGTARHGRARGHGAAQHGRFFASWNVGTARRGTVRGHGTRARYAGTARHCRFFLFLWKQAWHATRARQSTRARHGTFFAPWNAGTARHANVTAHAAQPETQARHAGTARHTLHILERRHGEARLAGTARGDCTGHICRVLDHRQGKPRRRARTRHCTRARHGTAHFRTLEPAHGMAREHCARARHGTAWHTSRILGRRRGTRTRQGTFSAS